MRTIHCIAFDPDPDCGTVGGVDWRVREEAIEKLWMERIQDPDYDDCTLSLFEVRVPDWASNQQITELVDEIAWDMSYVAIRRRERKEELA